MRCNKYQHYSYLLFFYIDIFKLYFLIQISNPVNLPTVQFLLKQIHVNTFMVYLISFRYQKQRMADLDVVAGDRYKKSMLRYDVSHGLISQRKGFSIHTIRPPLF